MNWDRIQGNWTAFKGAAKKNWGKLTDNDLTTINGSEEQLYGKLQNAYGIESDEAKRQVSEWLKTLDKDEKAAQKQSNS